MSDDAKNRHQPDRSEITLSQDYEVRYWTDKFSCTEEELRRAVAQVGNAPAIVEKALKRKATPQ